MSLDVQECGRSLARQRRLATFLGFSLTLLVPAAGLATDTRAVAAEPLRLAQARNPGLGPAPPVADRSSPDEPPLPELPLTDQEAAWLGAAWAYFDGPPPAPRPPAAPGPGSQPGEGSPLGQQDASGGGGQTGAAPAPVLTDPSLLVPIRSGTTVATAWSMGDQVAAMLIAHRLGLLEPREFDRRFTRLVEFLMRMPLGPNGMPNRFYDTNSGGMLGADLQPGVAGWSAVDTGRLLIWLRIAAETHPELASFIRNAVARFSVCGVLGESGSLQVATATAEGTSLAPETSRGYDAYAAQGYRAWGLRMPIVPAAASYPFEIEVEGVRFPISEDVSNQAPVMTTPPAYFGFEFGFDPLGDEADEVAGGRTAADAMAAVAEAQAGRYRESGRPTARAEFRRSDDPTTVYGTILATGYPWSVITPDGALRASLALISTRAAFALDAFAEDVNADMLLPLVEELYDPTAGWYEGRYERSGAYEQTRTSATNAFVMEALAYRHLGPLFPNGARILELEPLTAVENGTCRLPRAVAPTRSTPSRKSRRPQGRPDTAP